MFCDCLASKRFKGLRLRFHIHVASWDLKLAHSTCKPWKMILSITKFWGFLGRFSPQQGVSENMPQHDDVHRENDDKPHRFFGGLPHSTRKFLLDSWQRIAKQQRADKKEAETKRQHQDGHGATRSELLTTENMWGWAKTNKNAMGEERSSQLLGVPLWSFHMALENHHVFQGKYGGIICESAPFSMVMFNYKTVYYFIPSH